MSKDTLLKKDFQEKDVQRLRNLISNKFGNKTREQVGFIKKEIEYKEGDIWEENNKTWTIKNGIKQTYSKLSDAKKLYRLPLMCPKCSKKMGSALDKKLFPFHHMCFNCVVAYETALKMSGEYEDYMKNIIKNNANTFIDEAKDFIYDFASSVDSGYYTEDGERENWTGSGGKEQIVKKLSDELDELKDKVQNI